MTNFNVILPSFQQREVRYSIRMFFLESLTLGVLRKAKRGKNQNE